MKIRLLFLEYQGSSRARLAAAFACSLAVPDVEITCAAIDPGEPDAAVKELLPANTAVSTSPNCPPLASLKRSEFDVVVALDFHAAENLSLLPGRPVIIRWSLPDPAAFSEDVQTRQSQFAALRDSVQRMVTDLFEQGYVAAFGAMRADNDLILDGISDGLLVHDMRRRIVVFNRAAEAITGRSRADVIGRDCHEIFGCGFCGAHCLLQKNEKIPDFQEHIEQLEITTAQGKARTLSARVRPLHDAQKRAAGLMVAFHDITRERNLAHLVGEVSHTFAGMVGRDKKMLDVFELVRDVADTTVPILIQGESGTGKELVAAAIHNEGPRASKPFVAVNCGAMPEGLLESELFGHVRGAFTGAIRDKKGRFEMADTGTIFLDEIGDISPAMQTRLLRVLQEGIFQRVGAEQPIQADVRVISATHRDLQKEIAAGRFREDLYYRLNVVPIWMPALRERRDDIPLLVEHLLARFLAEMSRPGTVHVSPEAMHALMAHDWPGNVRELQNWLQYALVKCHGEEIRPEHFPPARMTGVRPAAPVETVAHQARRAALTIERVREALAKTGGSRRDAARELGVARATLYRFFEAHPDVFSDGAPKA
jgi:PAS domain S-box-containing protein